MIFHALSSFGRQVREVGHAKVPVPPPLFVANLVDVTTAALNAPVSKPMLAEIAATRRAAERKRGARRTHAASGDSQRRR